MERKAGREASETPERPQGMGKGGRRGDQTALQRNRGESQSGRKENKRPEERTQRKVGTRKEKVLERGLGR